jgi:hypothetical protein
MSDGNIIRLRCSRCTEPVSTEADDVLAKVLPLRAANDRRGKYKELRALIDAGLRVEVTFEQVARNHRP